MTAAKIFECVPFAIWGLLNLLVLASAFLALRKIHGSDEGHSAADCEQNGGRQLLHCQAVSILKPLCGLDNGLQENLESFFQQDHPHFELIFSVASAEDPAIPLVRKLREKYPHVQSCLVIGAPMAGSNPKVNNLVRSFELAAYDLVLISDSNTRVPPHFVSGLVQQLTPERSLIFCSVAGTSPKGMGGWLDASFLNSYCARGTLLAQAFGIPAVTGKAMLYRKASLQQFGGIFAFADLVAEDFWIGQVFHHAGLKVALSEFVVPQFLGRKTLREYWMRCLRWGRIRKLNAPGWAFYLEPLFSAVGSGAMGALASHALLGASVSKVFLGNLIFWFTLDMIIAIRVQGPKGTSLVKCAAAWLARELLHIPLWLHAALGDSVQWRGKRLDLEGSRKLGESMLLAAQQGGGRAVSWRSPPSWPEAKGSLH